MFAKPETIGLFKLEIRAKRILVNQKLETFIKLGAVALSTTLPLHANQKFTRTAQGKYPMMDTGILSE